MLPIHERPRERLKRYGIEALSSSELLSLLLSSGSQKRDVQQIASDLLTKFSTLRDLSEATLEELSATLGIGQAKAFQLQAAFELAKRLQQERTNDLLVFDQAKTIAKYFHSDLAFCKKEKLLLLLCDVKRRVFFREIIAEGTLTEVCLHPREVFSPAIRRCAHSFILVHNHPSGDSAPSKRDCEMTRQIVQAGKLLGIELLDHLILAKEGFFSFHEKGLL